MQTIARAFRFAALALIAASATACGVDSQEPPSLIGPSGFAQSVVLSASPDRLPRDGSSQSVITVLVRNESGQGVAGQRVTLGASAGTLSQAEVVTGSDGRATFTLTAPPPGSTGNVIEIFATPVGGNFDDAVTRTLSIALTGVSNVGVPVPSITITPSAPEIQQTVTFDASATTDEGAACTTTCTFRWIFSDGVTVTGAIVSRTFTTPGIRNVTLTVTDAAGSTATTTQSVTVADVDAPTVSAPTVSPNPVIADQAAVFTTTATADPDGHRIVQYVWNFGDGTTATTTQGTVNKTYTVPGQYVVMVTVTDDLGRTASGVTDPAITVVAATPDAPVARFTVSPAQPRADQEAQFDARSSTAGTRAVIVRYEWNFGDGTITTTSNPTIGHTYEEGRTYPVTLTVTDNLNRTSTIGKQVIVTD